MLPDYQSVFLKSGFNSEDLIHIDLEKTDAIMETLRSMADRVQTEYEIVPGDHQNIESSNLLLRIYERYQDDDCYIYTCDYEYCGMYSCKANVGLKNALRIAFNDRNQTSFILDTQFRYSFAIDYGDKDNRDFPNEFDVQYRTWKDR